MVPSLSRSLLKKVPAKGQQTFRIPVLDDFARWFAAGVGVVLLAVGVAQSQSSRRG